MSPGTTLEEAAAAYIQAKSPRLSPVSAKAYEDTLNYLIADYPERQLADFAPPQGTQMLRDFLDHRWPTRAPSTYNKHLSVLQDFFRWLAREELLHGDPAGVLERKREGRKERESFERPAFPAEERAAILRANPDLRDSVPLRLALDYGLRKGALRNVRFQDLDARARRVTVTHRRKPLVIAIPDDSFWNDLERLRQLVGASGTDYVLPKQRARKHRPTQAKEIERVEAELTTLLDHLRELASALGSVEANSAAISLADAAESFKLARDRAWRKVTVYPDKPRESNGTHFWWYGCLQRAGLVPPGVTSGRGMRMGPHTAAYQVYEQTGDLRAMAALLGMGVRTARIMYGQQVADPVDAAIGRVRREMDGTTTISADSE